MAIVLTDDTHYSNIADAIRKTSGKEAKYKPNEMAGKIQDVYDLGFNNGKQSEYDAFWDSYQNNGNRKNYRYMFSGAGWNKLTFRPKYDIRPSNAEHLFYHTDFSVDLVSHLAECGVELDTSGVTYAHGMFIQCNFTRVGVIDLTGLTYSAKQIFYQAYYLETIDKLIVKEENTFSQTFTSCNNLKNITIEGTIGSSISFQSSKLLTKESITSIINALSDTTSNLTVTFSSKAKTNAFTDDKWAELIAKKPNWTISLV